MKASGLFRDFGNIDQDPVFTQTFELDLSTVVPSLSGPKRPQDRISQSDLKLDFNQCLSNKVNYSSLIYLHLTANLDGLNIIILIKVGFKGFGIEDSKQNATASFEYENITYTLRHGSVVIAAITSCTNTSNPSVL